MLLETRGLSNYYGAVVALRSGDLSVRAGEIHALMGANGAGKSTLVKVLCGAVVPDEGEVLLDGVPVHFRSPLDPRKRGIETVYQDLAVAPALDIATNLFLGREIRCRGLLGSWLRMLDKKRMKREAQKEMKELKFRLPSIDSAVECGCSQISFFRKSIERRGGSNIRSASSFFVGQTFLSVISA